MNFILKFRIQFEKDIKVYEKKMYFILVKSLFIFQKSMI